MTDTSTGDGPDGDRSGDDPRADLRWGTIPAAVLDAVERGGDREAIVDGDHRWTWAEVGRAVELLASDRVRYIER